MTYCLIPIESRARETNMIGMSTWSMTDNILSDHNVQIEITIFNGLENQIINWSGEYY